MEAALKSVFTLGQIRELDVAAAKDPGRGHCDFRVAACTFGNRVLPSIEAGYKTATELSHLGEGKGLTALIDYSKGGSFFDRGRLRFEVPFRVRSSGRS